MSESKSNAKQAELMDLLKHTFTIASTIMGAIRNDKPERVDAILPDELKTSIAKAAGEARMRAKSGE